MRANSLTALLIAAVTAAALVGCSSPASPRDDGVIRIVASTNVYGDIAEQVGGDLVQVTSIISDPSQDPHSYEADAQVQLALFKADIVIQNGGGYDDFVDTLLKGANNPDVSTVNASTLSGYNPRSRQFNEHLWYDFPTMEKVTAQLAASLTRADAANASTFTANAATFMASLRGLEDDEATIKANFAGVGAAITESVPLYLLEAAGLTNRTPDKFSQAIEAGTDVSPLVLKDTVALFHEHAVKLLAYNEQTSGPETMLVLAAAKSAGIPVVPVRETLPADTHYLAWMADTIAAIEKALNAKAVG